MYVLCECGREEDCLAKGEAVDAPRNALTGGTWMR